jgi:hypothetical protein
MNTRYVFKIFSMTQTRAWIAIGNELQVGFFCKIG